MTDHGRGTRSSIGATGTTLARRGALLTIPALVGPGHVQVTSGGLTSVDTATYLSSAFYQTVDEAGTPLTQRNVLNFDGTGCGDRLHKPCAHERRPTKRGTGRWHRTAALASRASCSTCAGACNRHHREDVLSPTQRHHRVHRQVRPAPESNAVARTFTSSGGTLTVTNGDGVAGNPNFDVATHGVAYANIQQGSGLSVLGVTGASTANLADIVATGGTQCLQTNSGGTAVVWAACPTSGGGGSVTNVQGTAGQVTVVNNTTTPVISLVAKGAGAGAYGGSGIAGFSLDGFGAVTSVTPATYLTSTGTTPGTYNNLTVAGSGLITGASVTSWMTANDVMVSGGPAALPVGFSTFTYDGVNFAVNPGSGAGTMLFGVGGGVVMSMALGQVLLNAATVDVTALAAGGIMRRPDGYDRAAWDPLLRRPRGGDRDAHGRTAWTSAVEPTARRLVTVRTSRSTRAFTHLRAFDILRNVFGANFGQPTGAAGAGEVLAGIGNTRVLLEDVNTSGPGLSPLAAAQTLRSVTFPQSAGWRDPGPYFNQSGLGAYGPQWLPTSNSLPNGNVNEYPPRFVVSSVEVVLNVVGVSWAGGQTFDIAVTKNGTAVSGSDAHGVFFLTRSYPGPPPTARSLRSPEAQPPITFGILSVTTTGGGSVRRWPSRRRTVSEPVKDHNETRSHPRRSHALDRRQRQGRAVRRRHYRLFRSAEGHGRQRRREEERGRREGGPSRRSRPQVAAIPGCVRQGQGGLRRICSKKYTGPGHFLRWMERGLSVPMTCTDAKNLSERYADLRSAPPG